MANFSSNLKDSEVTKNRVGRNILSRNLWRISDKFKVLPTNEDFQRLSTEQVEWIVINMNIDAKEESRARSGKDPNEIFEDYDNAWLDESSKDFEPVKEGHVVADIAQQLDRMTSNTYLESLEDKFGNMQETLEYLAENSDEKTIEQYAKEKELQGRLEKVYEEARLRDEGRYVEKDATDDSVDFVELTSDSAQEAINLFEGDETTEDDQIWF